MMRIVLIVAGIWCLLNNAQMVYAEQETGVEARLAKIEARLDSLEQLMDQRFAAMEKSMDHRFTAMGKSMDHRLAAMDQRISDMMFYLQITFGAVLMVLIGLAGQWVMMWRRVVRVETMVEEHVKETEKDRLISVQTDEIGLLKGLLADFQQRLTGLEGMALKTGV